MIDRGSGIERKEVKLKEVRGGELRRDGVEAGSGKSRWPEVQEMLVDRKSVV